MLAARNLTENPENGEHLIDLVEGVHMVKGLSKEEKDCDVVMALGPLGLMQRTPRTEKKA